MTNNNALQVFIYGCEPVRTIDKDGEIWFVAKDVCDILEIQNVTQAVQQLDEDERAMFNIGRQGEANIITEAGLYSLILRSRKPEAKAFSRWVRHEVLPSIRKTGQYETGNHRKRMTEFDRAMKQGKEVYISMGYKGKKLAVALDKIYKDYLGFSALELIGVDPNDVPPEPEVTLPTWKRQILDYLKEHETVTPKDLSRAYGLYHNTAHQNLFRMERQGYLRKVKFGVYILAE